MEPYPDVQEALDQREKEDTRVPEVKRVKQDAQVYQDYQGRTLFKFRTMCKSGKQFQAGNWLVAARGIAVKLAEANGLKYYWVMSHFIFFFFIHLTFLVPFSGSAVAKLASSKRSP